MKVAIVGTGISGLTAAVLLHSQHDLTIYESADYVGGHTNTVTVEEDGRTVAVDTGFIVFNERTYPNFCLLMSQHGVDSQESDMSFSVRCEESGIEYNGTSLNALFAQRSNLFRLSFLRMVREILRFNRDAAAFARSGDANLSVGEFIHHHRYEPAMVERYLIPMGSAIWSCPRSSFRRFPMLFVAQFFDNHGMLALRDRPTWRVIRGGSQRYVEKLIEPFRDRIRVRSPVRAVRRQSGRVRVTPAHGPAESFDHVILACHSDQALQLLTEPEDDEREILSAFPYQENEAVLHTDTSILPRRKRAWASWNYHLRRDLRPRVAVTYNMNILQSLRTRRVYCVTLNESDAIDPGRVIRKIRYHHPLFTRDRVEAQARHQELIDRRGLSFCGAYWGYGFHEDGVKSALRVGEAFGRRLAS